MPNSEETATAAAPGALDSIQEPMLAPSRPWRTIGQLALLLLALGLYVFIYLNLTFIASWLTYNFLHYPRVPGAPPGAACGCVTLTLPPSSISSLLRQGLVVRFLLFQLPHVFMLLALVVFLMGIVRSFFTPERTRRMLAGKRGFTGNIVAALLGVVTPFCSCSAVPLFIGFVTAGVPLGVTITFLTAAPLVNEVALVLIIESFGWSARGWGIGALYAATGLYIALLTGCLMDSLHMERHVEPWVFEVAASVGADRRFMTFADRLRAGFTAVRDILGRVWPYLLIGIAVGAVLYAYVSQDALLALLGTQRWWSVPLAVLVGVPIYSNPGAIIPIAQVLLGKGVPLGTVLAFIMAVIGLSLPEFIILRRVLKMRLVLTFAAVVASGILIAGVLVNFVLARLQT